MGIGLFVPWTLGRFGGLRHALRPGAGDVARTLFHLGLGEQDQVTSVVL